MVTYLILFNLHFANEETCHGLSSGVCVGGRLTPVCISSQPDLQGGQAGCLQLALVGVFTPWTLAEATDQGFSASESQLGSIHRDLTARKGFDGYCLLEAAVKDGVYWGAAKDVPLDCMRLLHLGRTEEQQNESPRKSQEFSASGHFSTSQAILGSDEVPAALPSHAQAHDGVKTVRANCGLIKVNWCFIGVSDSFLLCSEH